MKKIFFWFLLSGFLFSSNNLSFLDSNPYDIDNVLPMDFKEIWYGNGKFIERIIKQKNINTIIEVGSWVGFSTSHMGSLIKNKGGKIYAIDHWMGSEENQNPYAEFLPDLYRQFLSNIIHKGLTEVVIPLRMSSLDASQLSIFKEKKVIPDLIYIDAAHDTESVLNDLNAWFPYVKGHGILCGDDWGWPSVRKAVQIFAQQNNLRIYAESNFYRLFE